MISSESAEENLRASRIVAAINKFMDSKDIPGWYRAFSQFQLKAADGLQAAIRDDVEQETTHRIRHCLSVLGVVPLLDSQYLQFLMKLSGGNDLAFLWFLMEFHYKTPGTKEYCINEQIILSAIAHLDMVTTLRGLDRVLPPGHLSKRALAKYRALLKPKPTQVSMIFPHNKEKGKPDGQKLKPYFQKLERPREPSQKFIVSRRPDFKVRFHEYEKYKDANYVPPNEANRWFTLYQIRDALRVSVIELRTLFDDFFRTQEFPKARSSTAIKIIDKALDHIDKGHGSINLPPSLCVVHQEKMAEKETKRQIRDLQESQKCLESLNLGAKKKNQRIERIHEMLKRDVEMYRKQFGEELHKDTDKQQFFVLDKDTCSQHSILPKDRCGIENPECVKAGSTAKTNKVGAQQAAAAAVTSTGTTPTKQAPEKPKEDRSRTSSRGSKKSKENNAKRGSKKAKPPKGKGKRATGGGISFNPLPPKRVSYAERRASRRGSYYDYAKIIPKQASQIFFKAATTHEPYKFLYENIFNDEHNVDDTEKLIKNITVETLNTKIQHTDAEEVDYSQIKLSAHPNVGKAAERYANDRWNKELAQHSTLIHDTRKVMGMPSKENLFQQQHMEAPTEMPQQDFYDCEDKVLMHRMLEIALNTLAQNHKYVLASIPDAHKLPDLREWIYQRYGKTYTQAERVESYLASQRLLTWLIKMKVNVKTLAAKDIARKKMQTYACYNYLAKKVAKFRSAYFNRVGIANMEFARLVWFAMNNYLCSIPQRGMFFSYMPQRVKDLHLINPWKLHQQKNMKTIWEQKQLKKAAAARLKF